MSTPTLAYRREDFGAFRRRLLQPRPSEQAIGGWRPAEGDLGLQILEWWAYLGDILSFYNERAANETYLRTATRPQSVADLVGLLGYRPGPGLAATGPVAAVRRPAHPTEPLVLPAGMRLSSVATPGVPSQTFEVDTTASFSGPSNLPVRLPAHTTLSPRADGTVDLLLSGRVSGVKLGDELLLVDRNFAGTTDTWVLVTVAALAPAVDPSTGAENTVVTLSTSGAGWQSIFWLYVLAHMLPDATGYRLLRPTGTASVWNQGGGSQGGSPISVSFGTNVDQGAVHLSAVVRAIAAGDLVLLRHPTVGGVLASVSRAADGLGTVSYPTPGHEGPAPGASTSVTSTTPDIPVVHTQLSLTLWLYSGWILNYMAWLQQFGAITAHFGFRDVGTIIGFPPTSIGGLPAKILVPSASAPPVGAVALLQDATGAGVPVTVTAASAAGDEAELTVVGAGTPPAAPAAPLAAPLQLMLDVVPVSRGVTVTDEVLGSGNGALAGQSFTLAKGPLTYLGTTEQPVSTLSVYVDGVAWREVDSFYAQQPTARVYVISRSADASVTGVTFGDGVNGARLPTGSGNVVATYRYGSGAAAPPAGRLTTIMHPQPNLASIQNPVAVSGGADPQSPDDVRGDAPASVSTFGRAISAADFQQIAARAPGVARAAAQWTFASAAQRALVTVYVGDDDAAVTAAATALASAEDPNRPVAVLPAQPQEIGVSCSLLVAADREVAAVVAAATAALSDPVAGLFSPARMGIGAPLYRSAASAALMVPGVLAVHELLVLSSEDEVFDPGPDGFFVLSVDNLTINGVQAGG